ncbi:hypothetical protein DFH94DRAFT_289161 [Russula ochroleuca]|uniref:X-box-binding protein 1 n=1 Tax=Russula ochroleuca TaxID=152965 RepID=A0A9P5JXR6_9AGAM|nr:hypothetical protein DFH94DRAFT_289161 [Russula ochroleuca]
MAPVNTSNLALPSPSPSRCPGSPTPSLSSTTTSKPAAKSRPAPTSHQDGAAPRKRSRSDMTTEERKEARASRNRIAAQNSRDKRKAQFTALEARINELEAENRALRAGTTHTPRMNPDSSEQRAADAAREAENRSLRERVRTLENAWEAIIHTLQTHGTTAGLPTVLPPPPSVQSSAASPSPSASTSSPSPEPSTTTFPVLVPSTPVFSTDTPVFPLSPAPSIASLPSGTPSQSIFDLTHEPTCHSARVVNASSLVASLQRVGPCKQKKISARYLVSLQTRPLTKQRWTSSSMRFWWRPPRHPPRRRY